MPRDLLLTLRERVRQIERPTTTAHGVMPFGLAAVDRVLPGGGLARGALHEILGAGGDEEDGALAAAFAASHRRAARLRQETALCCGASHGRISTDPVLPPRGSIRRGWFWSGPRAISRSCGRWKKVCAHRVWPRWWARSEPCPMWRAADYSSPPSARASPLLPCGAGAIASRRHANAICQTPP